MQRIHQFAMISDTIPTCDKSCVVSVFNKLPFEKKSMSTEKIPENRRVCISHYKSNVDPLVTINVLYLDPF